MTYIIIIIVSVFVLFIVSKIVINRRNKKLILTVTSLDRGTSSEKDLILKLLKNEIPSKAIFHDLMIRKGQDDFSQIDLVLATKQGIIVFEGTMVCLLGLVL